MRLHVINILAANISDNSLIQVLAVRQDHHGHGPPIPVGVLRVDLNHGPVSQDVLDELCRLAPIRLVALWRVNALEPDSYLLLVLSQDRDRVGVLNGDHLVGSCTGEGWEQEEGDSPNSC